MIFVTVGTQLGFDRLITAMDDWTAAQNGAVDVLAQIGESQLKPKAMRWSQSISPTEFNAAVAEAEIIVAHAGMGSVLTALELGKPLVLMPRRADLKEHRNDHQLATARWLVSRDGIFVAQDEHELPRVLSAARAAAQRPSLISPHASPALLDAIRQLVN